MPGVLKHGLSLAALTSAVLAASHAVAADCGALRRVARFDIVPDPVGRPLVPVTIEGRSKHLLVDTGGFNSMLERATVRELGLRPIPVNSAVTTVTGGSSTEVVRVNDFRLGPVPVRDHYFWVDPDGNEGRTIGPYEMAGLIGAEILRRYDADFDFAAGTLNLILQDHCPGAVVHWPAPNLAVVPFQLSDSFHISFSVMLDGKPINAILDTGAAETVMNLSTALTTFRVDLNAPEVQRVDELVAAHQGVSGRQGGTTEAVYRRRFGSLAVEGLTVASPMIMLMPDFMGGGDRGLPELIVGMSTLSKVHLYIAYGERKLYITPTAPPSAPPRTP
jgi:predicted aspartyl protease